MSKRQRDETSVASIQAILGDISIDTIENLLHRSNNNVEAAVNLYFSGPLPKPSTQQQQLKKTLTKTNNKQIKYFIGDLVITGISINYHFDNENDIKP